MKGVMSNIMSSMQPQLALLSQLDRRLREANLAAVAAARESGDARGCLSLADEVLVRAAQGGRLHYNAPLSGAAQQQQQSEAEAEEVLKEAVASFKTWVGSVEGALVGLRGKLDSVGEGL